MSIIPYNISCRYLWTVPYIARQEFTDIYYNLYPTQQIHNIIYQKYLIKLYFTILNLTFIDIFDSSVFVSEWKMTCSYYLSLHLSNAIYVFRRNIFKINVV